MPGPIHWQKQRRFRNGLPITVADKVIRLARRDFPVLAIAAQLDCTEADVMEAIRMLSLPVPGLHDARRRTTPEDEAARAKRFDKLPKKMQERMAKARRS